MTRKWKLISSADEALEAILALSKAERARLFDLMAREPALARYMMPPSPKQLGFELSAEFEGAPDYVIIFDGGSEGNPGFAGNRELKIIRAIRRLYSSGLRPFPNFTQIFTCFARG